MGHDFPFNHFLKPKLSNGIAESSPKMGLKELKLREKMPSSPQGVIETTTNPIPTINSTPVIDSGFSSTELGIITDELLLKIEKTVSPEKFNAFFKNCFIIKKISMDTVYFEVTTALIRTMITRQFSQEISNGLTNILGKFYQVSIEHKSEITENTISSNNNIQKPRSPAEAKFTLDLRPTQEDLRSKVESQYIDHMDETKNVLIDPAKTFDNFIVGPSNNLASAAALAIAKSPGKIGKYPSLYIYSSSGLGKTHLLHAVANGIRQNYPQYVICLITAREFMKEMILSIRDKTRQEFQKKYSEKFDVLMIDDIHELSRKEGTQDEFFHVFNSLHDKGRQLIFTSDKAPEKIEGIEERIRTRLQWGLVVDIQRPDLETRIALLKRKAFEVDLYLPDDIVNLIAVSIKNSIRELEGSVVKLKAFAELMQVEIDREITKDILILKSSEEEKTITLDDIAKATASYYKIHLADLKSKVRQKTIANARFVAMYLSRKVINATQVEIGHYFGGRDHSSVVHAEKEVVKRLSSDITLSKDITNIENIL